MSTPSHIPPPTSLEEPVATPKVSTSSSENRYKAIQICEQEAIIYSTDDEDRFDNYLNPIPALSVSKKLDPKGKGKAVELPDSDSNNVAPAPSETEDWFLAIPELDDPQPPTAASSSTNNTASSSGSTELLPDGFPTLRMLIDQLGEEEGRSCFDEIRQYKWGYLVESTQTAWVFETDGSLKMIGNQHDTDPVSTIVGSKVCLRISAEQFANMEVPVSYRLAHPNRMLEQTLNDVWSAQLSSFKHNLECINDCIDQLQQAASKSDAPVSIPSANQQSASDKDIPHPINAPHSLSLPEEPQTEDYDLIMQDAPSTPATTGTAIDPIRLDTPSPDARFPLPAKPPVSFYQPARQVSPKRKAVTPPPSSPEKKLKPLDLSSFGPPPLMPALTIKGLHGRIREHNPATATAGATARLAFTEESLPDDESAQIRGSNPYLTPHYTAAQLDRLDDDIITLVSSNKRLRALKARKFSSLAHHYSNLFKATMDSPEDATPAATGEVVESGIRIIDQYRKAREDLNSRMVISPLYYKLQKAYRQLQG
ncbi:hypothetical protein BJ508DRAFT_310582 [Ascobolus immersus RN42]|uniref:Uncharacterized protein n=1 Tax=Ascobolus immersus RN42 TaxID=1160509 RepID=A0A3N4HSZ0_ASCIM|nr:hypothetical protein BJ508DRAFT_310582 [Ascobolus immersus RN42]